MPMDDNIILNEENFPNNIVYPDTDLRTIHQQGVDWGDAMLSREHELAELQILG
ncbi:unnamed protein product [Strongylus vulgaris]|uniref:Uncharacterized protein n=1 Tax=Strongylus vulgaris TaxID=40348 RepID=A0A3P7LIV8_STRVU|nr:unnamed protein product [Strongylus vulgaris]